MTENTGPPDTDEHDRITFRHGLKIYRAPIICALGFVALGILLTGKDYFSTIQAALQDPRWWVDNTFSVIVFAAFTSWILGIAARHREKHERNPHKGWSVTVINGDKESSAPLAWEEVRLFGQSPLEFRRFIQSVVSSQGERLKLDSIDLLKTEREWLRRDDTNRVYRIDIDALRAKQAEEKDNDP